MALTELQIILLCITMFQLQDIIKYCMFLNMSENIYHEKLASFWPFSSKYVSSTDWVLVYVRNFVPVDDTASFHIKMKKNSSLNFHWISNWRGWSAISFPLEDHKKYGHLEIHIIVNLVTRPKQPYSFWSQNGILTTLQFSISKI